MKLHFPLPRLDKTKFIRVNSRMCQACWACIDACPKQIIGKLYLFNHEHSNIDRAKDRKGCKKCVNTCPNRAITIIKEPGK